MVRKESNAQDSPFAGRICNFIALLLELKSSKCNTLANFSKGDGSAVGTCFFF